MGSVRASEPGRSEPPRGLRESADGAGSQQTARLLNADLAHDPRDEGKVQREDCQVNNDLRHFHAALCIWHSSLCTAFRKMRAQLTHRSGKDVPDSRSWCGDTEFRRDNTLPVGQGVPLRGKNEPSIKLRDSQSIAVFAEDAASFVDGCWSLVILKQVNPTGFIPVDQGLCTTFEFTQNGCNGCAKAIGR